MKTAKTAPTPTIKRTRRHVVVRLTPDQARAFAKIMHGLEAPARERNKLRALATQAEELAGTAPPPAPKPTSISTGQGGNFRKGSRI